MFYKNIVYVVAQYLFGFNSGFSGQVVYDPLMYQLYNMTCTSLPIIWYSVFDFEYLKGTGETQNDKNTKTLWLNPELYQIGLKGECFSIGIFAQWCFYGLWHAFVAYSTTMLVLDNVQTSQADGKDIDFWTAG